MHFTVHAHYLQAFRKTSVVNSSFFLFCFQFFLFVIIDTYEQWGGPTKGDLQGHKKPQRLQQDAGQKKKKTAMFHSDEVRVSLVRRRNEPRLQRAKLRFPPIKTRNHGLTPTIVKRQLCLQGSALTRSWTLIACLQLIVRALITSDKEKHKSQGEAWPTAGPGRLVGGKLSGADSEQLRSHYVFVLTKSQPHLWYFWGGRFHTRWLCSVCLDENNLRMTPNLPLILWCWATTRGENTNSIR